MRIAICLSGQLRDIGLTRRSLERHILSPFRRHQVNIFAHYPLELNSDPIDPNPIIGLPLADSLVEDERQVLVPLPVATIHNVPSRPWHNDQPLRSFFLQVRSIHLANEVRKQYEKRHDIRHDWVFRLRFDNLYFGAMVEDLARCDPRCVYIPHHDNWAGYNDKFAFGGPDVMDVYAARYSLFSRYQEEGNPMHPEIFLMWVLDNCSAPVRRTQVATHLLRYGRLYRAYSHSKWGDVPQKSFSLFDRLDARISVTRFASLYERLYLAKVRMIG